MYAEDLCGGLDCVSAKDTEMLVSLCKTLYKRT